MGGNYQRWVLVVESSPLKREVILNLIAANTTKNITEQWTSMGLFDDEGFFLDTIRRVFFFFFLTYLQIHPFIVHKIFIAFYSFSV
jgi:hypothetical protein